MPTNSYGSDLHSIHACTMVALHREVSNGDNVCTRTLLTDVDTLHSSSVSVQHILYPSLQGQNIHLQLIINPPPVNGVVDHTVLPWGNLDEGQRPCHQLVVVLKYQVLGAHLHSRHVGVLKGWRELAMNSWALCSRIGNSSLL